MTLHLKMPSKANNLSPKLSVIGVGGTGGNIINSMIQSNIQGVEFLNVNTDSQALKVSLSDQTLQLGPNCTQGLGAGADPKIGRDSAEEVTNEIQEYLEDTNMVFITAGMGGGTGTGASPVIARIARDMGILIVGVVTKPFEMEGKRRMEQANEGIQELQKYVDNLIVIPNQNIYHFAKPETTFSEALQLADNVLIDGVKSIIDLMVKPGIMNHDFADVKAVMSETGKVHMATGESSEENERSLKATEDAICNPLLENNSMTGARGVLINVTGGNDITLHEVDQAVNRIREESDENANIIIGLTQDEVYNGKFKISIISTGIDSESYLKNKIEDINIKEFGNDKNESNITHDIDSTKNKVEKNIVDNGIEEQTNFFVDLENKNYEEKNDLGIIDPEANIKNLEDKAKEFKVEENLKNEKKSFFSKIFGKKEIEKKPEISPTYTETTTQSNESSYKEVLSSKENDTSENNTKIKLEQIEEINIKHETIEKKENQNENIENNLLKEKDFFNENKNLEIKESNTSYENEDLLQIPAFLRRQAN